MTSEKQPYSNTAYMVLCGLFAALCAICAMITIPLGFTPVPVNLTTLAVFLSGGILGKKYGTVSLSVYVLLGAAGVPVFAGFRGGLAVLAGPTGGYIIGYIAAAFTVGFLIEYLLRNSSRSDRNPNKRTPGEVPVYIISMIAGLAVCYLLGTLWFTVSTGTGIEAALISCVLPFLPGDAIKITVASLLVKKLRPILK